MYHKQIYAALFPHIARRQGDDAANNPVNQTPYNVPPVNEQPILAGPDGTDPITPPSPMPIESDRPFNLPNSGLGMQSEDALALNDPGSNTQAVVPNVVDSQAVAPQFTGTEAERALQEAENTAANAVNKDKGWKGRVSEIVQNFLWGMGQAGPNADWIRVLGSGATAAGVGAFKRNLNETIAARQAIPNLRSRVQFESQMQDADARRKNLEEDNKRQRERFNWEKDEAGVRRAERARQSLFSGKHYSRTNPSHRSTAIAAGLDPDQIPEFDFRTRSRMTINGETYISNDDGKTFSPSGLPASERDRLVEINVSVPNEKGPDGKDLVRTFKVPQSQAATLTSNLQMAGMNIRARETAADRSRAFTARRDAIQHEMRKELANHKAAITRGNMQEAARIKARLEGLQIEFDDAED